MSNKKTIKYRVDFSAHHSIVVEVPDTEDAEYKAVELAESYMENTGACTYWEVDDGGVEEADPDEEPVNDVNLLN